MKKYLSIIAIVVFLACVTSNGAVALADTEGEQAWIYDAPIYTTSEKELEYANHIADEYELYGLNYMYGQVDYVQEFACVATIAEGTGYSYNVIGVLNATATTDEYVIIACNYNIGESDATDITQVASQTTAVTNYSGLMTFFNVIDELRSMSNRAVNYLFVAFGATTQATAGSDYFLTNLPSQISKNTLCAVYVDSVIGGDNLYAYTGEEDANFNAAVYSWANAHSFELEPIPEDRATGISDAYSYYPYENFCLTGDVANLFYFGIPTISFQSGNWDTGMRISSTDFDFESADSVQQCAAAASNIALMLADLYDNGTLEAAETPKDYTTSINSLTTTGWIIKGVIIAIMVYLIFFFKKRKILVDYGDDDDIATKAVRVNFGVAPGVAPKSAEADDLFGFVDKGNGNSDGGSDSDDDIFE